MNRDLSDEDGDDIEGDESTLESDKEYGHQHGQFWWRKKEDKTKDKNNEPEDLSRVLEY